MRVLVLSAHADDETFGMGGTILRHKDEGDELYWMTFTKPWYPKWDNEFIKKRLNDIYKVAKYYDFNDMFIMNWKDNRMDENSMDDYQSKLIKILEKIKPEIIYYPTPYDMNYEHRMISKIVEFSTKPYYSEYITALISYEIPSSTECSLVSGVFKPNYYVDITDYIEGKIKAIRLYETEIKKFPHPRSEEYIIALSKVRGGECFCEYAEGFQVHRYLWRR